MPLDVTVIERQPVPDGQRFWEAVARILPRTVYATAAKMQLRAPRGKSGKLSRRVDVRVHSVNQGFVFGVQADFGVAVPYGHLVAGGHRIIARGRAAGSRGAVIGSRTVTRTATLVGSGAQRTFQVAMPVRSTRLAELRNRQAAGSQGRVPGNPFARGTLQEDQGAIVRGIEQGLTDAV